MKPHFFIIFLGLCLWVCVTDLSAKQKTITIDSEDNRLRINEFLDVYHTPDTINGAQAYQQIKLGQLPESSQKTNPGMLHPKDGYWISFSLRNNLSDHNEFLLELDHPQMDYLNLYEVVNGEVKMVYQTGDMYPFDQRPYIYRSFVLPLKINHGSTKHYLLNVEKRLAAARFPLFVYTPKVFASKQTSENIYLGLYIGSILLLSALSLIVFAQFRQSVFALFSLNLFLFALFIMNQLGLTYQLFVGDYPILNRHSFPFILNAALIVMTWYIQVFFQSKKYAHTAHIISNYAISICIIFIPIWIIWPDFIIDYGYVLLLLRYLVTVTVIICCIEFGRQYFKIKPILTIQFLAAYFIYGIAVIIKILSQYAVLDDSYFPVDPIILGSILEIGVLTLSMIALLKQKLLEEAEKSIRAELQMKELHHRVKNNLQVISSLLNLQSMQLKDESAKRALTQGKERLRAMELVHEKLYLRENVSTLNIKDYIQNLTQELSTSYLNAEEVDIHTKVEDIDLRVEVALPVGLIVNELVSNAFKYAYQGIDQPTLGLDFSRISKKEMKLEIKDNGDGLPEKFNIETSTSFGLKLVNLLVEQLHGKMVIDQRNGLVYSISFGI
ncbi:MAG: histidine kinase dimerization/phosphoacceptor domain -containing protein [Cyclobacteriaceae bacterium]